MAGPKPLKLPEAKEAQSVKPSGPRPLSIPASVQKDPMIPNAPRVKTKSKTDELIEKAQSIEPSIESMRIRGRFDTLLTSSIQSILDWGERNLAPLRTASSIQSQIASRMAQINAIGWLNEAMEESCKIHNGFLSLFSEKKTPDYYESMLNKTRSEIMALLIELTTIDNNYRPEVKDLQLDSVALMAYYDQIIDDTNRMVAQSRAKSLMVAHQTGVMLLESVAQTRLQCAKFIQQIDDFMSITLPNWKMAHAQR